MQIQSPEVKAGLHARLRRIEGQTHGIQKMLDDERDCRDILQQLNAVHAAIERATAEFVRVYAKGCMLSGADLAPAEREVLVDELLDFMARVK